MLPKKSKTKPQRQAARELQRQTNIKNQNSFLFHFLFILPSSMASKKIFHASRPSYIFPTSICDNKVGAVDGLFEFDESDVWSNNNNNQVSALETTKKPIPSCKKLISGRKTMVVSERKTSASLPVNVPDWSQILKDDYKEQVARRHRHQISDDDDFDDDEDHIDDEDVQGGNCCRMPPHEYLARKRGASLSVHEGIGRTLKGRDLRRVRNAIWKKIGFED